MKMQSGNVSTTIFSKREPYAFMLGLSQMKWKRSGRTLHILQMLQNDTIICATVQYYVCVCVSALFRWGARCAIPTRLSCKTMCIFIFFITCSVFYACVCVFFWIIDLFFWIVFVIKLNRSSQILSMWRIPLV